MEEQSLQTLGIDIQSGTKQLSELLNEYRLPQPSFKPETPDQTTSYPSAIQNVRGALLDKLDKLRALVLGPRSYIYYASVLSPSWIGVFNVLYHFQIARHVPAEGAISYHDLSQLCGLEKLEVIRIVRAAISLRIFCEESLGFVSHNAFSKVLTSEEAHNSVGFFIQEFTPAALKFPESLQGFPRSDRAGEAAIAIANGGAGDQDIFTLISNDQHRVERFAKAMSFGTTVTETSLEHFMNIVPWSCNGTQRTCPKVVVDIGGSQGDLCEALLRNYPDIQQAIVQDRPETIKSNLERKPAQHIQGRISYQSYDFFTEQPLSNADVLIFRTVLHDWPDSYTIQILRNQIPAMAGGTKILINDICIDARSENALIDQARRAHDIFVKMGLNAGERSRDDWISLLRCADARFKLVSIVTPPQSVHSIIEVAWRD